MKIKGKLINVERFDTSYYGNPRYLCVILSDSGDSTVFYTGVNSSHGYSITNYLHDNVSLELAYKYNKLTLLSIEGV